MLVLNALSNTENFTGSQATGSDGDTNRVITLSNTGLSRDEMVAVDTFTLHPTKDYTISHAASGTTITFVRKLFNEQNIRVLYFI